MDNEDRKLAASRDTPQETSPIGAMEVDEEAKETDDASPVGEMEIDEDERETATQRVDVENESMSNQSSSSSSFFSTSGEEKEHLSAMSKLISEEQSKLSYNDRNILNEEVHGVACNAQEETPEMLRYYLSKLSLELEDLVLSDYNNNANASSLSTGFLLSRRGYGSNNYVNKADFRLRFLRAENFDVRKAAIRLMKFMNLVLEVFGAFALCRPIKLTDFKRSEMKVIQAGWVQVFPFRDRSGRRLFIWAGQMGLQYEAILRIKIYIYMVLSGTRDTESQQKGIVSMIWPGSVQQPLSSFVNSKSNQLKSLIYCNRMIESLPVKICAIHCCIILDEQRKLNVIEHILLKMTSKLATSILPRVKMHVANYAEVRKNLSSYGIPVSFIPATQSGAVKKGELKKWLKLQRRIDDLETAEESFPHTECPGSNDVVFRPGSSMIANPGNVMFRSLIESKVQEVIANSDKKMQQKTKEDIAMEIINEISQRRNARFLWWDNSNGCWVEFDDIQQVKSKVAITYRDLKLKILKSRQSDAQI